MPGDHRGRSRSRRAGEPIESRERQNSWVKLAFVDGGYAGDEIQRAAYKASRIRLPLGKRTDRQVKGFIVLPKRWIVERTFGWVNRARRFAEEFKTSIASSQAWFILSLTLRIDAGVIQTEPLGVDTISDLECAELLLPVSPPAVGKIGSSTCVAPAEAGRCVKR